jgi:hypothetical protein
VRSDPRIGLAVSLCVVAAAALWLLGQWVASDALWAVFGFNSHALTFFSIFFLLCGLAAAALFGRYASVKTELLGGRNVIASWRVTLAELKAFSPKANARDRAEKRSALYAILFGVAVIFGLFALFDREAAPQMLAFAAAFGAILVIAYWLGERVRRAHLQMRSGEVIVGTHGLLFNGVLHVWSTFMSWLEKVKFDQQDPPTLTITYAFLARYGPQSVSIMLPVPPDRVALAREIVQRLDRTAGRSGGQSPRRP